MMILITLSVVQLLLNFQLGSCFRNTHAPFRKTTTLSTISLPRSIPSPNIERKRQPNVALTPIPPRIIPEKNDNMIERSLIFILSKFLTASFPENPLESKYVFVGMRFKDFVQYTKSLFQLGEVHDIRARIVESLTSLIPTPIRYAFKRMFLLNPKFVSEKSSLWMNLGMMTWLVGPTERFDVNVESMNGGTETWKSGVKLTECRYLREAGCKASCIHLCKVPTQQFFADELGYPVYMEPNFSDCSCKMHFGVKPPPIAQDSVFKEPCYQGCGALQHTLRQ